MWKKVLYFGVMVIIGMLFYTVSYNSNQYNYIYDLAQNAINNENYDELPKIFGGCFDTNEIIHEKEEEVEVLVYPGTSSSDSTYIDESEKEQRVLVYEESYYLYLFNSKFSYLNITNEETVSNKTAIRFNGSNGSYDYYFVVNDSVNSDIYKAAPKTLKELVLNSTRDLVTSNSNWNFININITKTMIELIEAEIGDITGFDLINNEGDSVYTCSAAFDFSEQFFTDVEPLIENYTQYLDNYLAGKNDAVEIFNEWYTPWQEEFSENSSQTGYSFRYEDDELVPSKVLWQTIGMMGLYVLCVLILYVLFFHFNDIRRIFSRDSYKDYSKGRRNPIKGSKNPNKEA